MSIIKFFLSLILVFPLMAYAQDLTPTELQEWARTAAIAAYTSDYKDYESQLNKAVGYFTPAEGKNFKEAYIKSGNLAAIRDKKLTVSAEAIGKTKIVSEKANGWIVKLPLRISYTSAENKNQAVHKQVVLVTMDIVKIPTTVNAQGIGINQFDAEPLVAK